MRLKINDMKLKLHLSSAVVGYAGGKELYPVRSKVKVSCCFELKLTQLLSVMFYMI